MDGPLSSHLLLVSLIKFQPFSTNFPRINCRLHLDKIIEWQMEYTAKQNSTRDNKSSMRMSSLSIWLSSGNELN